HHVPELGIGQDLALLGAVTAGHRRLSLFLGLVMAGLGPAIHLLNSCLSRPPGLAPLAQGCLQNGPLTWVVLLRPSTGAACSSSPPGCRARRAGCGSAPPAGPSPGRRGSSPPSAPAGYGPPRECSRSPRSRWSGAPWRPCAAPSSASSASWCR